MRFYLIIYCFFFSLNSKSQEDCQNITFSPNRGNNVISLIELIQNYNPVCPLNKDNQINNDIPICYSYAACESYYDYTSTPHPLFTSLIYTLEANDNNIAYGSECAAVEALSKQENICDQVKFNTIFNLDHSSSFNKTLNSIKQLKDLNEKNIKENFEVIMKDFIKNKSSNEESYSEFINEVKKNYYSLVKLPDYKTKNQSIVLQFALIDILCKNSKSYVENPLYNSETIYNYYENENLILSDLITNKIEKFNSNPLPDYFSVDLNLIYPNRTYNSKSPAMHSMTLVSQYHDEESKDCLITLKDSNPHYNDYKCITQSDIPYAHYDENSNSCFYTFKRDSLARENRKILHGYCQVETTNILKKTFNSSGKKVLKCGTYSNPTKALNSLKSNNLCQEPNIPKSCDSNNPKLKTVFCITDKNLNTVESTSNLDCVEMPKGIPANCK
jgi:hypothetical protein